MNKETYTKIREEGRARRKERREKVEAATKKAGSSITVLTEVANGSFHSGEQPVHNRASRRSQLGITRQRGRHHKTAYRERGSEHRAVVQLRQELQAIKRALENDIRVFAKRLRDLG